MLDFDDVDAWAPKLGDRLITLVPSSVRAKIAAVRPRYIEDARDLLFQSCERDPIIDLMLSWLSASTIAGYHGTRLGSAEVASIRANGLLPLKGRDRRERLSRALSTHRRWREVAGDLDAAVHAHGEGSREGRREGQAHLTLSRSGLTKGF